jgi:4-amino-4-deoxy-L-arabinose transferase-like glycosyltransferase
LGKTPTSQIRILREGWKIGRIEKNFNPRVFQPSHLPSPLPFFYLVFIITLAFGLRVVQLNTLPLSLSLDEAVDGLDALQLVRLGWLTPFLQNNFGRETLFFYLQGSLLELAGISIFSLRFASVLAGTLTIPLLYAVGRRLGLERATFKHANSSLVSLLAATGLAVSYWHLYFSRVSLRAILLPPLLLALIWCFWRGWYPTSPPGSFQKGASLRYGWLAAAGFLLGLTFYTYLAARLLPVLFVTFVAVELIRDKPARPRNLLGFLIFAGTAALTTLPLALYFQQNPQALNSRTQAISVFASNTPVTMFGGNFLALLRLHFLAHTWLGQWPALDLLTAVGFLAGLLTCLYHFKKPAGLFLLLWWATGTAPVLLSTQDWTATTTPLRGIMAWPALYLLSAMGLVVVGQRISAAVKESPSLNYTQNRLFASPLLRRLTPLILLLIFSGLTSSYNYFSIWATTYNDFSDHPPRLAHYLNGQTKQLSLTPLRFYSESVFNFLLQARYPNLRNGDTATLRSLLVSHPASLYLLPNKPTAESLFVLLVPAANGQGTAYLLPPLSPTEIEALAGYTRATNLLSTVLDGEGEPIAQVYPLVADAPFLPGDEQEPAWQPIQASFKSQLLLAGYRVEPATLKPGETVTLFLNWQAQQPIDGDYYLFIHLFDVAQRQRWGQVNTPLTGLLFNAHRWPVGLTVPDKQQFTLPADAPDGAYRFEVGLHEAASQQRLPVTTGDAASTDDKLILGKVQVWQQSPLPPQYPLPDVQFGESIALAGFDMPTSTLRPGQTLSFNLHWQVLTSVPQNYTVFTHLLDSAGQLRAQQDNPPQQGRYPTSWWSPGETIIDPHTLLLPPDLAPGSYTLRLGLYQPETGQRLPLKNQGQDFVDLPNFIKLQN